MARPKHGRRTECSGALIRLLVVSASVCAHFAEPCAAQTSDLRLTQYVHDVWTVEEGLPQKSIYAVLQTRDGYLWMGTQDGLVRFDGVRFKVFNQTNGLKSSDVNALMEDRAGHLWIGTNGGGVARYDGQEFLTYTTDDGLSNDLVRSLYEDRAGNLWLGTIGGGLNRFDGTSFTHFTTADGLSGDVVLAIREAEDGSLWVGTEAGLSRFRDETFERYTPGDGLPGDLVWALHPAADGSLWIGATGGLARLVDGRFETYGAEAGICGTVVGAVHEDASGALWIGTFDGGICRFADGRFESFSTKDGLTNDRVRAIFEDREQNLWIGTERGGLNRLREGKFTHVTTKEGLAHDVVFSVLEDREGTVWIGTEGGGLGRVQEGRITHVPGLPSDQVYALNEGAGDRLWIGMYDGGLCGFENEKLTCFTVADGLQSNNVYAVHEDTRRVVWVGTEAGLARRQNGKVEPFEADDFLASAPISALREDAAGDIWVGTYGGGVSRIENGGIDHFGADAGLSSEIILTLYEDGDGTLWAGTQGGGLCRFQDERFECLASADGLPNDNILQILHDDAGYLWLGTLQGIARVAARELHEAFGGSGVDLAVERYDKDDGLKSTETSGGTQPSAWRTRDGRLWFATDRGVAVIDPADIRRNPLSPPVVIEGIAVAGEAMPLTPPIVIPPGGRDLTFRYSALGLTAPGKIRFQYRLDGYDEQWTDPGTRREAYYTNLPPGSYTFHVRAANEDGVWNETGASVSLRLQPFFYETTWFLALAALGVLLLALSAYLLRIRQLKARERELERVVDERTHDLRLEKEKTEQAMHVIEAQADKLRELDRFKTRFFANVSHEFRTPLTMIVGPLENLLAAATPMTPETRRQLEIMLRNALRLMRLINQLLDLSKLEEGKMALKARARNIVAFLEEIVVASTSFAERKGIDLTFRPDVPSSEVCYEPDKLEKVIFNLVSNALKFTPVGGAVTVTVAELPPDEAMPDGAVEIRVHDTGKGIPEEELPLIFDRFHQADGSNTREHEGTGIGLALAKEMVLLHHGRIEVTSKVGHGTEFTVTLPRGARHLGSDELAGGDSESGVETGAMAHQASMAFEHEHGEEPADGAVQQTVPVHDAPTILVIDDNADVLDYVAGILRSDYRVITACNGEEGLSSAEEAVPDLIVSDVMMPRMDGHELCRRVKNSPRLNHIPVILLTARATHEVKLEGLEVGADDYMAKPFNAQEIRARIRNLLHLRHHEKKLKELNEHLEERVQEQVRILLRQRKQYEEELLGAKERAEASDRLKTSILNNLSHEFRTPLTAVLGYADILAAEAPDELLEFISEIEQSGQRLMTTLDALLELSDLEVREVGLRSDRMDLVSAAEAAMADVASTADRKGLNLHLETSEKELWGRIDAAAVDRILRCLLENAVKFTSEGEVRLELGKRGERVAIRVADTGIGIGPEFQARMFEAFTQESEGLTRTYDGVGLGLTIVRRLVDLLEGDIEVESECGRGSVFTLSLPVVWTDTAGEKSRRRAKA